MALLSNMFPNRRFNRSTTPARLAEMQYLKCAVFVWVVGLSRHTIAGKWIGDLSRDGPLARAGKLAAQWTRSMSGSFQVLSKKACCGP